MLSHCKKKQVKLELLFISAMKQNQFLFRFHKFPKLFLDRNIRKIMMSNIYTIINLIKIMKREQFKKTNSHRRENVYY
jgi:hypothetical protein